MVDTKILGEVLLYFIPALLILVAAYMMVSKFLDKEYKIRLLEAKRDMQKDVVPLRLQAYERMCLFLERISANNVLYRAHKPGMTAKQLHQELLVIIRTEYEHNITQQIYISPAAWAVIKNAKEDLIRIINVSAAKVGEKASGIDLSKTIFEVILQNESIPTQKALDYLKNEVKNLF